MRIITVYKPTNITGEAHPAGFMNGLIGGADELKSQASHQVLSC